MKARKPSLHCLHCRVYLQFIVQIIPNLVHPIRLNLFNKYIRIGDRLSPVYSPCEINLSNKIMQNSPRMSVDVRGCPLMSFNLNVSPISSFDILGSRSVKKVRWGSMEALMGLAPQTPAPAVSAARFFVHLKSRTKRNQWEPVSTRAPLFDRRALFKSTCPFWSLAFFLIALQNTLQNNRTSGADIHRF